MDNSRTITKTNTNKMIIQEKKLIQLKEIAHDFLNEFDTFLLENDISITGSDIIETVKMDGKVHFVSLIDMVINEKYYYDSEYSMIMDGLQNLSSKYCNEYSDIRLRIVAFSNSPTTLAECEDVQDVNEGFFKKFFNNKSFFTDKMLKLADDMEKDAAEQMRKDHPEVFEKLDKAGEEFNTYLDQYAKSMGLK